MAKVKVTFRSKMKAYLQVQQMNMQKELEAKAEKTLGRARMLAPVLSGDLKMNGRVEKIPNGVSVVFGDSRIPYARRRHFENRKSPATLNYLERAGDQTRKEGFIVMKGNG
nr:MAG TPA: putative tail-component [Caudoviricetes sp.]